MPKNLAHIQLRVNTLHGMWEKGGRHQRSEEALEETCSMTSRGAGSAAHIKSVTVVCQAK